MSASCTPAALLSVAWGSPRPTDRLHSKTSEVVIDLFESLNFDAKHNFDLRLQVEKLRRALERTDRERDELQSELDAKAESEDRIGKSLHAKVCIRMSFLITMIVTMMMMMMIVTAMMTILTHY